MDAPTAPAAAGRPVPLADGRVRTVLVLLVLVLVLPLAWSLVGPPVALGEPFLLLGVLAGGAAALAIGAAVVAPVGVGLDDPVRRSWRTSLLMAMAIAGLQVLLSIVAIGTYGAALRFSGRLEGYLLLGNALAAAATVATLHVVVSVVRTWRARAGAAAVPVPRPWLLAVMLVAAVALSVVTVLIPGAL